MGADFSSFMTNYNESYIEDFVRATSLLAVLFSVTLVKLSLYYYYYYYYYYYLTVDSTLKHFVNSKGFQRAYVKKIQNHVNLLVSQNAGFIVFNAGQKYTIVSVICHP